jgi:transcriptional regulator with GAF, ATPase, and Fis domain
MSSVLSSVSSFVAPPNFSDTVHLMVVSSSSDLRKNLMSRLESELWVLREAASGAEALEMMEGLSAIILDPELSDLRIDDFREIVQSQYPGVALLPVNPHTGQMTSIAGPTSSLHLELLQKMQRGSQFRVGLPDTYAQELDWPTGNDLPGFIGRSAPVRRLCSMVRLVAHRDTTLLITGESGTGKDVVARAVHHLSQRRSKPFVVINCAAIPEALLEAELFGFVKGAFTGAVQSNIGRIHSAQGGTLFLDEIGDLPLGLQSKLLRFLEQGEIQRLGSTDTFRVDVRVIAATNANLHRLLQEHRFREDLFYRLSIFPIELAALRERLDDLGLLVQTFLNKFSGAQVTVSAPAMTLLQQHGWPGNVRELRNVVERACILLGPGQEIRPEHILL